MKKRWIALIAFVSLALGGAGASWFWLNFNAQFIMAGLVTRTQADIVTKVSVLERLRAGRVADATRLQEMLLDGDLIGAGALARTGTKFNANTRHAVELELKARAASGYTPTDENVRNAVQEVFDLVPSASDSANAQPGVQAGPRISAAP